jgi:carbamoyltransferase
MILGIYHPAKGMGHDSGVALIGEDGRIVAAHSEERFSRIKMDGGFPFRAFEAMRKMTGFSASDLSCVAVPFLSAREKATEGAHLLGSSLRDPIVGLTQVRNRIQGDQFQRGMEAIGAYQYVEKYRERLAVSRSQDGRPALGDWRDFLSWAGLDRVPLVQTDHHIAHAAGAYLTSGWNEALLITCDGVGALKSSIVAEGRAGRLRVIGRTFYPHSPGEFWELITAICGFHHMKHGGKITGLAALGDPHAPCYEVMRAAMWCEGLSIRSSLDPVAMARKLSGATREDIAATAQRRLEEVVTEMVANAVARSGLDRLALSGGVFANVKLNQRLAELPGVREVYIYPAMGDEGIALGAALFAAARRNGLKPFPLHDVYFGPEYPRSEIEQAVASESNLDARGIDDERLAADVAQLLATGRVVALFRGRMEFGPRALGHRTILYQTTDQTVNDWLNKRLARTEFMPFAPVTLEQFAGQCYRGLESRSYATRFMTITADCTEWTRTVSPAVVHRDGTARPQIIGRNDDPLYYAILQKYHELTGIPSLINTSFNMHEEPIVCSPADAVRAFTAGDLDYLVIGNLLVKNRSAAVA